MKNYQTRLIVILLAIGFAAYAVSDRSKFKLGPDLTGGTILAYKVKDATGVDLDEMVPALKNRLDPAGLKNYTIYPLGNDRVQVTMPKAEIAEVEEVKLRISTVGQLEFRIVADRRKHRQLMEDAEYAWQQNRRTIGNEGRFVPYGIWDPVPKQGNKADEDLINRGKESTELRIDEEVWFRPADSVGNVKLDENLHLVRTIGGRKYVLARWSAGELFFTDANLIKKDATTGEHYVLMFLDPYSVTGEYLTQVNKTTDENLRIALAFNFNDEGASRFRTLTTEYKPEGDYRYNLGIILDGRLRSAPALNAVISSSGIITGNFTDREISALESVLESGKLPYALEKDPVQERTVGPSLGEDTIRSGAFAILVSFALVVAFTVVYYRRCGMIAVLALFLNLLFTIALMVLFQATWTLPGLAGLVLTVGMAVDSNVLIFERMREELDLGRPLGLAIRGGYEKAWGTIFDSNLTTILTAVILFWIGTDQVKGFAVTLILGILTSMFSAVYITRAVFQLLYDRRWLRQVSMMRWLSKPNYDFLQYSRTAVITSVILIGVGVAAVAARGWNMLDIDFTGGTAAGLVFKEPTTTGAVRSTASTVVKNPSVISMEVPGEPANTRFLLRTEERDEGSQADTASIRKRLGDAFEGQLATVSVSASGESEVGVSTDSRLKPFQEGKSVVLTFDPPQPEAFARQSVNEAVVTVSEGKLDPIGTFVVIPEGEPTVRGDRQLYTTFQMATNQPIGPIVNAITTKLADSPVFDPFDQFGAQVAGETQVKAIWAMALSWLGIIVYIWFRFGTWSFGVAGVVALVHDVLVAIGLLALFSILAVNVPAIEALLITDMKINLDIVAALLTLIGFSINDTIVIFDRIREVKGKSPRVTREMVTSALNGTLSRTIITSLMFLLVVAVLFAVGGEGLHGFAFVLVVGAITGTYSTIFIACPLVLFLENWRTGQPAKPASQKNSVPATV